MENGVFDLCCDCKIFYVNVNVKINKNSIVNKLVVFIM